MRVTGLVLGAIAIAVGPSAAAAAHDATGTSLRITYWADYAAPATRVTWTLRCAPPRGSLPRPGRACLELARGGARLFAPLPPNSVCTEIYGGADVAQITGAIGDQTVDTTIDRTNGCGINDWDEVLGDILPPAIGVEPSS